MKNRLKILTMLGLLTLQLTACGNSAPVEEIAEDVVQVITVEQEAEATMEKLPSSKEELFTMTLDEFKAMIEDAIPNYREFFKVSDDKVLEDSDWENFRAILSIHLFGDAIYEPPVVEETAAEEEDPNAIYYAPTAEFLNSMTDEEFVQYLSEVQAYNYPDSEPVDYSGLTPEEIAQVKAAMIPTEE